MAKIAIVGGTGDIGEGAARLAKNACHEIRIGSRKPEDAKEAAEKYKNKMKKDGGIDGNITGHVNPEAVKDADVVFLAVPYKALKDTLDSINPYLKEDAIIISPIVPMKMDEEKTFDYVRPSVGSAAEEVKEGLIKTKKVVSAFHNVPARKLADYGKNSLECSVAFCGDDKESNDIVSRLIEEMGAEAKYAGRLCKSYLIESVTPFLLNLKTCCGSKEPYTIKLVT